jgi:hypothetical protein
MANTYLLSKEKGFINELWRFFDKSKNQIIDLLIDWDTKKGFSEDLTARVNKIIGWTVAILLKRAKPVLVKWASTNKKLNPKFKVRFDLVNAPAVRYLQSLDQVHSNIHLVNSIGQTTYSQIIWLVNDGVTQWLTYSQIAKKMQEWNPLVFSKSRAEIIAIWELWKAYEFGKLMPMKDLQDKWEIVLKKWQTVEDSRVRPLHDKNQRDWYIPLDVPFSWTGDMVAPTSWTNGFRCRCATVYKVV